MTLLAFARLAFPFAPLFLFGACSHGGQTGEGDSAGPACADLPPVNVPMTETTPLGFSAEDVLGYAEQPQSLMVSWSAGGTAEMPAMATLSLNRRGSSARFIDSEIDPPEARLANNCTGRLEVDVALELQVSDATGTMQASSDTVLIADSSELAHLWAEIEPSQVSGDSRVQLSSGESLASFRLSVALSPLRSAGIFQAVTGQVMYPPDYGAEPSGDAPKAGPYTVEREQTLMTWPANSACGSREIPVALDESLFQMTPRSALDLFTFEAPLVWWDGGATTVRFSAAPRSESACLARGCPEWCQIVDYSFVSSSEQPLLGLASSVSVTTDDGRWGGQFDAILQIEPLQQGGLRRLWIAHDAAYPSAEEFTASTGLSVPLAAGQEAHLTVVLLLDVNNGQVIPTGTVSGGNLVREPCGSGEMCAGGPGALGLIARIGTTPEQ